jgi:hypothetical protein
VRQTAAFSIFLTAFAAAAIAAGQKSAASSPDADAAQTIVSRTCAGCHNDRTRSGGLSLESFTVATAGEHPDIAEKMIRKLRAGLMRRPARAVPKKPRSRGSPRRWSRRRMRARTTRRRDIAASSG